MSWYNLYKQSNALPFDIMEAKPTSPSSYVGYGVKYIDDTMTEETAKKEEATNPKYLGSGFWGVVVDIGNDRARKYTSQKTEAEKAQSLIGLAKYPIVKIFSVKQLQDNLWAIDMEKCTPVEKLFTKQETDLIDSFLYMLRSNSGNKKELYDDIKGVLSGVRSDISENIKAKYNPKFTSYLTDRLYPLLSLKEIGLLWDCKVENIVVNKNGDWVLCDLAPDINARKANNWYNIYKQSNSEYSEWWICSGNEIIGVSEGDLENHAAYVKKHAEKLLCRTIEGDSLESWLNIKAEEIKQIQEIDGYEDDESIVLNYGEKLGVITGDDFELYLVANGNKKYQDMRNFAMEKWGWKIVRGKELQTYYLTNQDLKTISNGIAQIFPSISNDFTFNIEVMSNNKYFTGIKYGVLKQNSVSKIMVGYKQVTGY